METRTRLFVAGLLGTALALAPSSVTFAQAPKHAAACPANNGHAARTVLKPLVQQRLGWFRRMYGLTALDPSKLRHLNGKGDAAVCQQLTAIIQPRSPWTSVYYRADGFYFASFRDTTPPGGETPPKAGFIFVFDRELKPIAYIVPK